jgi:hypothetical protein
MQYKADARCKTRQMLDARQGRYAMQGKEDARYKARLMREAKQGR